MLVNCTLPTQLPLPHPNFLQFGDKLILEYLTHQRRLMPALATVYAMHLAVLQVKVRQPAVKRYDRGSNGVRGEVGGCA